MVTFLAPALAVTAGFLAWRKSAFSVALLIFMLPFDWAAQMGAYTVYSNEWILLGLGAGWLARMLVLRDRSEAVWSDWLWGLPFLMAVLLSILNAFHPAAVIKQTVRYAEMVWVAGYVANACTREREVVDHLRLWMGLGLVVSVLGIMQTWAGPRASMNAGMEFLTLYDGNLMRAYSTFGHPNQLAGYLILIIPVTVVDMVYRPQWRDRFFSIAALIAMVGALLLTFSRGAWLGLGLMGAALYLTIIPKAWFWKGLAIGALGIFLLWGGVKFLPGPGALVADRVQSMQRPGQEDSVSFRKVCLQTAWAMTREHPWIGYGAGEYERNIRKYFDENYYAWVAINKHIHNLYVQILIESGVLGLVGFAVWLLYWLRLPVQGLVRLSPGYTRSMLAACLAGVLAFLLHNHFDVLLAYARGVHLAVLLGLGMAWVRLTSGWLWQKSA